MLDAKRSHVGCQGETTLMPEEAVLDVGRCRVGCRKKPRWRGGQAAVNAGRIRDGGGDKPRWMPGEAAVDDGRMMSINTAEIKTHIYLKQKFKKIYSIIRLT